MYAALSLCYASLKRVKNRMSLPNFSCILLFSFHVLGYFLPSAVVSSMTFWECTKLWTSLWDEPNNSNTSDLALTRELKKFYSICFGQSYLSDKLPNFTCLLHWLDLLETRVQNQDNICRSQATENNYALFRNQVY